LSAIERAIYINRVVEMPLLLGNKKSRSVRFILLKRRLWYLNFGIYSAFKRVFGLLIALILLVLLSPLFLIVSILIKREDGGKILFKQLRTGRDGKEFYIYKFRTMVENNDIHDKSCADKHTKIGKFLRNTSIDELPQLFNIVKGEMAFIGPRPWITDYYEAMNARERARTIVSPGITGLAQANGRNGITIFEKINYDLEYVKGYSILTDFRVIVDSIKAVVSKANADAGKNIIHNELKELRVKNALRMII